MPGGDLWHRWRTTPSAPSNSRATDRRRGRPRRAEEKAFPRVELEVAERQTAQVAVPTAMCPADDLRHISPNGETASSRAGREAPAASRVPDRLVVTAEPDLDHARHASPRRPPAAGRSVCVECSATRSTPRNGQGHPLAFCRSLPVLSRRRNRSAAPARWPVKGERQRAERRLRTGGPWRSPSGRGTGALVHQYATREKRETGRIESG